MKQHKITIPLDHLEIVPQPPFYFLSDIHLSTRRGTEQDARRKDLLELLREIAESKGTLFILGDFFDFWFDCRSYIPKALKPVVKSLAELRKAGIPIHYIGGNHDYWIPGYLTEELGICYYREALSFEYEQIRFYCVHGDQVVYNHFAYPLIRRILHAAPAIALLKCLPAPLIYYLGERVSHYNRVLDRIPEVPEKIIGRMQDFLLDKFREAYDIVLCGHVHKPLCKGYGEKHSAILGDWIRHRSYGVWDKSSGFRLLNFSNKT